MDYVYHYESPLGGITLASNGEALVGVWFDNQKYYPEYLTDRCMELPVFNLTVKWLDIYFSGACPDFTPPLYIEDTDFRECVWGILLTIPYGKTMSYKKIAEITAAKSGYNKMSAQAVGGAVGHNPISLIIPCHRVVGSNGSLTGYAGGINRKMSLLKLEGVDTDNLFIPPDREKTAWNCHTKKCGSPKSCLP